MNDELTDMSEKAENEDDEVWTAEDEAVFRPLYRKLQRIRIKELRNKTRVNKFSKRTTRK